MFSILNNQVQKQNNYLKKLELFSICIFNVKTLLYFVDRYHIMAVIFISRIIILTVLIILFIVQGPLYLITKTWVYLLN